MTYTEAPASLTFKGITEKGFDVQFTLRDQDEMNLLKRFGEFVKVLEDKHVRPKSASLEAVVTHLPPTTEQVAALTLPGLTHEEAHIESNLTFDAELLEGSMYNGKPYWKVKGGQFSKFGVPIYPEALAESGIDPDKMDITKEYPIKMVAHYVLNDKGKASKVTLLAHRRPGAD